MLETRDANFCLCHGLAGNAEILLHASSDATNDESKAYRDIAEEVAVRCMEYGPESGGDWRGCIDTPGLMVGWAGIGSFYLRLRDGAVPSALLLGVESFSRKGRKRSAR
jgi:lantibiotic modifying enzyme